MNTKTVDTPTFVSFPLTVVQESCPGGTYFRTSEVTPFVEDGELHVFDGIGVSRSWGRSQVTSSVTLLTPNVIKVNVVGWHKHTVSPVGGNFYFVRDGGKWMRRTAGHRTVRAALAG
jgi:hypothetical protein